MFALARPNTAVFPGPDGALIMVVNDDTAIPIIGGLVGAVLGLMAGGELLWPSGHRR